MWFSFSERMDGRSEILCGLDGRGAGADRDRDQIGPEIASQWAGSSDGVRREITESTDEACVGPARRCVQPDGRR